jgi:hypothetical protein
MPQITQVLRCGKALVVAKKVVVKVKCEKCEQIATAEGSRNGRRPISACEEQMAVLVKSLFPGAE